MNENILGIKKYASNKINCWMRIFDCRFCEFKYDVFLENHTITLNLII